ncbi:MAG: hypothetical protein ACOZNI_36580 [Myxococcota bacterium]
MVGFAVAAVACVVYVAISLVVGDRFPFSRYSMYASLTTRDEGAVLYVRSGDRFLAPDDLDAVFGLDVPALDPARVPCSQQWAVYEAQRWLASRAAPAPPEGAVPIELGWRMLRVDDAGGLVERLAPVTAGVARLRA